MKLTTIKKIGVVGLFLISFLVHFIYQLFPNSLFSIFFPVNESIWEHMKMLYTTVLIYSIIEYFLLKKFKVSHNNFLLNTYIISIICIPIYLLIFLPLYYKGINNMIIIFIIMIATFIICECISYFILNTTAIKYQNLSIILIIITYIIFGYLTYYPIKTHLFFDTEQEKYGINDYAT